MGVWIPNNRMIQIGLLSRRSLFCHVAFVVNKNQTSKKSELHSRLKLTSSPEDAFCNERRNVDNDKHHIASTNFQNVSIFFLFYFFELLDMCGRSFCTSSLVITNFISREIIS